MNTSPAVRAVLREVGIEASRIGPRLYQGARPPPGHAVRAAGYDVLVLCAEEYQEAHRYERVTVLGCPLNDDGSPMAREEWRRALKTSCVIADLVEHGARALVTCMAGRNRSGLVTALALWRLTGADGRLCADHVRRARRAPSGPALSNTYFYDALARLPAASPQVIRAIDEEVR